MCVGVCVYIYIYIRNFSGKVFAILALTINK